MDKTALMFRALDRARARRGLAGSELSLFERQFQGREDEEPFVVEGGWLPKTERVRGQVETLLRFDIVDREELTPEIAAASNRINWDGMLLGVTTYNPPIGEPRYWTFFAEEVKEGAIKR